MNWFRDELYLVREREYPVYNVDSSGENILFT